MIAITDAAQIANLYGSLAAAVTIGAEPRATTIGYQSGSERATVHWLADIGIWVMLEPDRMENRYWCAYGLEEPHPGSLLPITTEINIPRHGINRQVAGVFAEENGSHFLLHSGKVGGGRPGIRKEAFLRFYVGPQTRVEWPDRQVLDYLVLSDLSAPSLFTDVARFVRQVADFKNHMTQG